MYLECGDPWFEAREQNPHVQFSDQKSTSENISNTYFIHVKVSKVLKLEIYWYNFFFTFYIIRLMINIFTLEKGV